MTEQENVQSVQSAYPAFSRGDIQAVLEALTDDVEWVLPGPPAVLPFAGIRRGREQVLQFFAVLAETLTFEQFEPRELIAQDDKVVVLGHSRDRMRSTGRVIENEWAAVFTLRDGKIARYQVYEDTAAFVSALGPD
jgi:ketosteroid isomerase-like protein